MDQLEILLLMVVLPQYLDIQHMNQIILLIYLHIYQKNQLEKYQIHKKHLLLLQNRKKILEKQLLKYIQRIIREKRENLKREWKLLRNKSRRIEIKRQIFDFIEILKIIYELSVLWYPSSVSPSSLWYIITLIDTTPCMKQMLDYEDCAFESNAKQLEIIHPSWPSMWPRMLTDGKVIDFNNTPMHQDSASSYAYMRPLTKKIKHYLWECEEERFVYKACLRHLLSLKKTDRHTSWDTAPISNITLT